jgi:pimeloyl-ACP methyl ester carboxylesterase
MAHTVIPGARAETLEVAGVKTHLIRAGKGEPVLLLHGLGASSYSWRFAVPALAERYEVFAPDLPGFGRADKPWDFDYSIAGLHDWVVALMDRLGLEKARFAGNSMGGVITLWMAMDSGARVERMALLGTPAYPENRPKMLWPLGWPVIGRLYEWALGETTLRYIAKSTFVDQSKVTEELIAEYLEPLKSPAGRRAVAEFIRRAMPPDHRERVARYPRLTHPALVLIGDSDRMVGRRGGERLAAALPRARFECVERCGHAPQEDAPERVIPMLRDFFAAPE